VALTELADVSTVAKTLVEALNDVLQNLDTSGSVDSRKMHACRAQTLAKFFYDRNGHGGGEVLLGMLCVLERVVTTPKVLYVWQQR